jgi:hypothetical protein
MVIIHQYGLFFKDSQFSAATIDFFQKSSVPAIFIQSDPAGTDTLPGNKSGFILFILHNFLHGLPAAEKSPESLLYYMEIVYNRICQLGLAVWGLIKPACKAPTEKGYETIG